MVLPFSIVNENAKVPSYAHDGDAGLDLSITEDVSLRPFERKVIGVGLAFAIPKGHVGLLFPRSGLATKKGVMLSNCVAVIDSGYRGEVGASLLNVSDKTVRLERGERVCQMVIVPFESCTLERRDELDDTERGTDGFGSTGTM